MRTAICIVAHAGDQKLFDQNWYLWARYGFSTFVATPSDAPVKCDAPRYTLVTNDGGKNHVRRWRELLRVLATCPEDRFVLFEPDSFCLAPEIPKFYGIGPDRAKRFDQAMIVGNVKHGIPAHASVSSPYYILHPMIITKAAVEQLADAFASVPDTFEGGHSDRALYLLASQCGIRIADFQRYGMGYADIRIFPSEIPAMRKAIEAGAIMIHGLKDEEPPPAYWKVWPAELPLVDEMTACWIPGPYQGYLLKDLDSNFKAWFSARASFHETYPELVWGLR